MAAILAVAGCRPAARQSQRRETPTATPSQTPSLATPTPSPSFARGHSVPTCRAEQLRLILAPDAEENYAGDPIYFSVVVTNLASGRCFFPKAQCGEFSARVVDAAGHDLYGGAVPFCPPPPPVGPAYGVEISAGQTLSMPAGGLPQDARVAEPLGMLTITGSTGYGPLSAVTVRVVPRPTG